MTLSNVYDISARDPLSWGGPTFPAYDGNAMATGVVIPSASGSGEGGAGGAGGVEGAGSPPAAGSGSGTGPSQGQQGAEGGSPPPASAPPAGQGAGTGTGQGAGQSQDPNLATLRANYEKYRRLGEPDAVSRAHSTYQAAHSRGSQVAEALGYTTESFDQAFHNDPVATMLQLENELVAAQNAKPDEKKLNDLVDQKVREHTSEFQQIVAKQKADSANAQFAKDFDQVFGEQDIFKGATDVPKEVKDVIRDMVSESLKYDQEAIPKFINGEPTSAYVKKYVDGVVGRMLTVVNAFNAWQAKRGTTQQAGAGQGAGAGTGTGKGQGTGGNDGLTLEDILEATPKATSRMSSLRTGS